MFLDTPGQKSRRRYLKLDKIKYPMNSIRNHLEKEFEIKFEYDDKTKILTPKYEAYCLSSFEGFIEQNAEEELVMTQDNFDSFYIYVCKESNNEFNCLVLATIGFCSENYYFITKWKLKEFDVWPLKSLKDHKSWNKI